MKVARLYSFNDIRIEESPVPEPGPGDALIRTKACGICSGDVMPWYIEKKAPLVLGHEPSGEIVAVGNEVRSFRKGDRVFTHHHAPCFSCKFCMRGDYVQCPTWRSSRIIPGGVSEYILIPAINLQNDTFVLPESLSFEDGTLVEPAACVVKGLKRAKIKQGDTVLVIGLGVMGMINVLLAREYGAGRVIGADMVRFRLDKALAFGADEVIDVASRDLREELSRITSGEMAELVIVGPNSAGAMLQGISCARPGGQVLFFTPAKPGETLTLDPNYLYFNDINIITSYSCGPDDTRESCALIEKGVVSSEKLVTHRFPVEEISQAFKLTARAKNSLKALIVFD
ncbi:MAG: sorbitol dehydrogenase [Nitrospiraceae bacterium]|nr:MAG: sorbitol dehydrogenase [Nitrospiraceae bacterium]